MVNPTGETAFKSPVLETKFYFPRWRPGLVPRTRLVERLSRGTESRLTLVSAPPGFGKTTLLAEWLAADSPKQFSVAWLSLEASDNHPATFWTYLFTALQRAQPELGRNEIDLLQSPQPPPIETMLAVVLNEVATRSQRLVLVLDDYHVIEPGPIHDGIAFLIDHLPPQMHLVLASRADPMVPLSRLRARGELVEIRAADLRFTAEEAALFLNSTMGLQLSAQEVVALESRTEGWIAALQLAALSMRGRADVAGFITAFSGDDRYIVDYLVEEVLQLQPETVRNFLLETSILDRLCAPLCDAVTGADSGKAVLETLERGNLFVIPLDANRQWYRYHHLFADVLRAHLREEMPHQVSKLYGRASGWYEQNGYRAEAIRCAVTAGDFERAAGLIEFEAEPLVRAHQPDRLVNWLEPIPEHVIRSMPVLSTYYALALQGVGDLAAAESYLGVAERWLSHASETAGMKVFDDAGFQSLPSRIALGRGYQAIASKDVAQTLESAQRALDLLPDDEHHWRGTGAALVSLAHWANGDLERAEKFHEDAGASLERAGDIVLALNSAYHHAELLKARGRLSDAGQFYERSLRLAAQYGSAAFSGEANVHFGLCDLHCERGDLERSLHHLKMGDQCAGSNPLPRTIYRGRVAEAGLLRARGDLAGALEMLDQAEPLFR
ncbi:MAG: AAA family ATPase, partial [Anaerolineaceae bacterium]